MFANEHFLNVISHKGTLTNITLTYILYGTLYGLTDNKLNIIYGLLIVNM